MEREEGERVNWCYSTFHHHHHQQQQQQSHRIARILHSVTFRLQSRYGGHYVCAVVCLFVCLFVLFCFRGSSATEHCGDLRFQYCNIFCVCVCACVRACVRVVVTRQRGEENLGKWKCSGGKFFAKFVHMIMHIQLLQHVTLTDM